MTYAFYPADAGGGRHLVRPSPVTHTPRARVCPAHWHGRRSENRSLAQETDGDARRHRHVAHRYHLLLRLHLPHDLRFPNPPPQPVSVSHRTRRRSHSHQAISKTDRADSRRRVRRLLRTLAAV